MERIESAHVVLTTILKELHDHARRISDIPIGEAKPPRVLHVQEHETTELVHKVRVNVRPGPRADGPAVKHVVVVVVVVVVISTVFIEVFRGNGGSAAAGPPFRCARGGARGACWRGA
jgi:hypothetical protein